MKLEANEKFRSGKWRRHHDIKNFYATDLIERKEMEIEYCLTDVMIADFMTKPLVGKKFIHLCDQSVNAVPATSASRSVLEE
jgi:hypothetical protein